MLYHKIIGEGPPLIILHGLLGMSDNWMTLGKKLAVNRQVILVDQRNHGRSFHDDEMNYDVMSDDVYGILSQYNLDQVDILGHSMGGKTAMRFAQRYPRLVRSVVSVDIAPRVYRSSHDHIFKALLNVNLSKYSLRGEVDKALSSELGEPGIRQFLLKNLMRTDQGFRWRANVKGIFKNYDHLLTYPNGEEPKVDLPILFVGGTNSDYINKEDRMIIESIFSNPYYEEVESGHWIHAEKPKELLDILEDFLHKFSE